MDIAVSSFSAADHESVAQAYEVRRAADAADVPDLPDAGLGRFVKKLANPLPGHRIEWAIARVGGAPAGCVEVDLPLLDNTESALVDVHVHPALRRRGVGRALHAYAAERAAAAGRKRLIGDYVAGLPGGPPRDGGFAAFAAAVGAVPALAEVRRRLDVTEVDEADLAAVLADAYRHAAGYTVVGWTGATPEEYLADVAYLDGRMSIDSPMGDLAWEPEKVDADRIRASDEVQLRWGRVYHTTVAVHVATGQVVAWSGLSFEDGVPWHAWQQNTIVEERHRGHRLGTIVKIENLRRARAAEPGLRFIDTLNAAENTHMIAINEALGFRPVDAWHDWQQDL